MGSMQKAANQAGANSVLKLPCIGCVWEEAHLLGPGARGVHNLALGALSLGGLLCLPLLHSLLLLHLQPALVLHHALHTMRNLQGEVNKTHRVAMA